MGLGLGQLRLSPLCFWSMSPREFKAAVTGFIGTSSMGIAIFGSNQLNDLMQAYPDQ